MAAVQCPPNPVPQVIMNQTGVHPVQVAAHQPVNIVVQNGYNVKSGHITGWMQLSCAIASFVIGTVQLLVGSQVSIAGTGIWGGLLFFLPTGILGLVSKKKKTSVIVAYMAMSIISAFIGFVLLIVGIVSAILNDICYSQYGDLHCGYEFLFARVTFGSFLAITGIVEIVVAIVAACYCCAAVCCGRNDTSTFTMVYPHYQNNATPMAMMVPAHGQPAGQPMEYHQPPPVNQPLETYPTPVAYPQGGPQPEPGPQPNYNMEAQAPPLYSEVGPDNDTALLLPAEM